MPLFLLADSLTKLLSLGDYNTRVVLLGTTLLGIAAGIVGTFMLLRRQSLVGDVVSHAALPGVAIAFLVGEMLSPGSGRSLSGLLIGAAISGLLAVGAMSAIRRWSKIKPDAALATVLGVFFGGGAVLFKVVQEMPAGNRAGLQHFILGSASTMTAGDVWLIAKVAVAVLVLSWLIFKELSLLAFDEEFAATQGWPIEVLDFGLLTLVVAVTVIGLQSVGVLMVALLITPSTAARFWTEKLSRMTLLAALFGGGSALVGTLASALVPKLAGGPTIVIAGTIVFVLSLLFGTERGLLVRWQQQREIEQRVGRHDLLRAIYEVLEASIPNAQSLTIEQLLGRAVKFIELQTKRSWAVRRLMQLIDRNLTAGLIRFDAEEGWRLTQAGALEAQRIVRNHRLWELYLIECADFGASHVDRLADDIEHVLEPEVIEQLERSVAARDQRTGMPPSPHPVESLRDSAL